MNSYDVVIIGGGPAGSATALYLQRRGYSVCVLEKKQFPRETLCGEFLSREVTESLKDLGFFGEFLRMEPNAITALRVHTEDGLTAAADLGFTGYGMKRGSFDQFMLAHAAKRSVAVVQPAEVKDVARDGESFIIRYEDVHGMHEAGARRVVGAYGKQNILDKRLHRNLPVKPTHLNGVKFHVDRSLCPGADPRSIHIFTAPQMYCGVNVVDENKVTVCFLERREAGSETPRNQFRMLSERNTAFRGLFTGDIDRTFDTERLYGTGNIYFGHKEAVVDGVLMVGDAAGVIAPLTGDGMGMAFEGARLAADIIDAQNTGELDADAAEMLFIMRRNALFRQRLLVAAGLQRMLLSTRMRRIGMKALHAMPGLLPMFVRQTRG